jgi:hypothetical protein
MHLMFPTVIGSPGLICGASAMSYLDDFLNMTPKQRVFGRMKNLLAMIADSSNLEADREQLKR